MKAKILFYLEDNVNTHLREFINKKYKGFERGLLSMEIEEAIRYYLKANTHIFTNDNGMFVQHNTESKVLKEWEKIKKEMIKQHKYIPRQLSYGALIDIFMPIMTDPRSQKKWLGLFIKYNFLKLLPNGTTYEVKGGLE